MFFGFFLAFTLPGKSDDIVTIEMIGGQLQIKDQVREYMDRGDALLSWSYMDFVLDTYDGKMLPEKTSTQGRSRNMRVPYRDNTGRSGRCRILRSPGHETMPYIPGPWLPKRKEDDQGGLYEACILALLKPWSSLVELKGEHQNFRQAYDDFVSEASLQTKTVIENIAFYHDCAGCAQKKLGGEDPIGSVTASVFDINADADVDDASSDMDELTITDISEEDIRHAIDRPFPARDLLYADIAVDIGVQCGALKNTDACPIRKQHATPLPATAEQLRQMQTWHDAVSSRKDALERLRRIELLPFSQSTEISALNSDNGANEPSVSLVTPTPTQHSSFQHLNEQQSLVVNIVQSHLLDHLNGKNPRQRLMIVHGEGGTGKSTVVSAITNLFEAERAGNLLAKTAMSGVAACIIGGQTLHSWAALPVFTPRSDKWLTHPSKEVNERRKSNMTNVLWVIIDEMSMLTTPLLQLFSRVCGVVRSADGDVQPSLPFGGLSVILTGDFHQFPPVATSGKELYNSNPSNQLASLGRNLYEQFDIVVILKEQMRITDPIWNDILKRSRTGDCTKSDITEIQKLVLVNPECDVPDFMSTPWNDTVLITPRNTSRMFWNCAALDNHCSQTGHAKFIIYARDTDQGNELSLRQRLEIAHLKIDETNRLPNKIEVAIGMKAMVLLNIAPGADLANGTRGVIVDIILDPRETAHYTDTGATSVILQYPPSVILFRPLHHPGFSIPGLSDGVLPLFPTQKTFSLPGKIKRTIHREQFALTPAYAFTDFKSQGQTIDCVLVDLGKPPTATLTSFNAYVALSRSRGRSTIRLLRNVDETLFTRHPSEELRKEDDRLNDLANITLERYKAGEFRTLGV